MPPTDRFRFPQQVQDLSHGSTGAVGDHVAPDVQAEPLVHDRGKSAADDPVGFVQVHVVIARASQEGGDPAARDATADHGRLDPGHLNLPSGPGFLGPPPRTRAKGSPENPMLAVVLAERPQEVQPRNTANVA